MDLNALTNAAELPPSATEDPQSSPTQGKKKRIGKVPHDHPTKVEIAARIQVVYKLLLKGWDVPDIIEYCGKPTDSKKWVVKRAAAYKYVDRARERLWSDFDTDTKGLRNQAAKQLMEAYKMACSAKDQRGMIAATRDMIELYGLKVEAPIEVHHTGTVTLEQAAAARERLKAKASKLLPPTIPTTTA